MKFLREIKWHALLKSLMYIAIGVVALIVPDTMISTLGYLMGIILIMVGLISMLSYLFRDPLQNYYHDDFIYGLCEILIGVLILLHVDLIIRLVPILLGVLVLISGFAKLQDVIDMKRLKYDSWIFMLILAIINMAAGVVLIANPFWAAEFFFKILGGGLIFSGFTDFISVIFFAAKIKKIRSGLTAGTVPTEAVDVQAQTDAQGLVSGEKNFTDELSADNDSEGEIL